MRFRKVTDGIEINNEKINKYINFVNNRQNLYTYFVIKQSANGYKPQLMS